MSSACLSACLPVCLSYMFLPVTSILIWIYLDSGDVDLWFIPSSFSCATVEFVWLLFMGEHLSLINTS